MNDVIDPSVRQRARKLPLLVPLIASSPIVAMAAILWRLFAMDRGRFAWSEDLVAIVAIAAVVTGFVGSIYCLATRRGRWWVLISMLSIGLGYLGLQIVVAAAWGHMH
jgi:hypothetical protein